MAPGAPRVTKPFRALRERPNAMTSSVPQYIRDHARDLEKRSIFVADSAMRYGSPQTMTLLALIASGGRSDYPGVVAEAKDIIKAGRADAVGPFSLSALAYLARAQAGRPGPGFDLEAAADLWQAVRILRDGRPLSTGQGLPGDTDRLDAQTNLAAGRFDYVERILPDLVASDETRWMLETELLHPDHGRGAGEDWLRRFNGIFEASGLSGIRIGPGPGSPFDRIEGNAPLARGHDGGPLVSLIMSVFQPDRTLVTALKSLTAQSWPHLQIMVVDDCSPSEYQPLIDEAVALDDRIELYRMPENGGTYKIRNFAISQARGDIIGFQDSDDWSHPERIEQQLAPMLADPHVVATLSRSVRVFGNLSASKLGYSPVRRNVSSLLMRRDPVLTDLGSFDDVRKSADSEFLERMEGHFGEEQVVSLTAPLALVQLTSDSLSRTDFQFGWRDGNRVAYRQAFEHWHDHIAAGDEPVRLTAGAARRFPAPRAFVAPKTAEQRQCDVILVSDWRAGLIRYGGAEQELCALVDAGESVELLHAEAPRHAARRRIPPSHDMMHLAQSGVATFARWEEPLTARVALVRDPELLCYPRRNDTLAVGADTILVRAAYPPRSPERNALVYDPVAAEEGARTLLGGTVIWLPATAEIAEALSADGASADIASPRQVGVVARHRRSVAGFRGARPIVGTTGLEGGGTRDSPSADDLVPMLPDDDAYDVRIRDPLRAITLKREAMGLPPNWLLCWDTPLEDFVDQLDVFVGVRRHTWGPEFIHEAAVAAARGCVVILPPEYAQHFGGAAIYAEPSGVRDVVTRLWCDGAEFAAQQERGYVWAAQNLSPQAFHEILGTTGGNSLTGRKEHP